MRKNSATVCLISHCSLGNDVSPNLLLGNAITPHLQGKSYFPMWLFPKKILPYIQAYTVYNYIIHNYIMLYYIKIPFNWYKNELSILFRTRVTGLFVDQNVQKFKESLECEDKISQLPWCCMSPVEVSASTASTAAKKWQAFLPTSNSELQVFLITTQYYTNYSYHKSQTVFKMTSPSLQASFTFCQHVSKYSTSAYLHE